MKSHRHARVWFPRAVLAMVLLVVSSAPARGQNSSIDQKRKQAAKISAQIDATSTRIEQLNEDYLTAQQQLVSLKARLAKSTADHDAVSAQLDALRIAQRNEALKALAQPGGTALDALQGTASLNDYERQVLLQQLGSGRNADVTDALRSAQADLARTRSRVDDARKRTAATSALLARKRTEADTLIAQLEALERSTQGELATLVAQEQQRQAAAEARRVQAAFERRRATALAALEKARAAAQKRASQAGRSGRAAVATGGPSSDAKLRELAVAAGVLPNVPTSPGAAQAVRTAMGQLGKPYVWAAAGPGSFDCSGLVMFAWRAAGRALPHSSRSQYSATTRVPVSAARPGDLVFFGRPIHHVGMYIGNGQMVEAPYTGALVRVRPIFRRDLVGIGRVG